MPLRVAILLLCALVLAAPMPAAARALTPDVKSHPVVVAQEEETEQQDTGGEAETEAETGAGEGETGAAAEETGPPWTYQMARLGLLMLLALALGIAWWYYSLIVKRRRGEI